MNNEKNKVSFFTVREDRFEKIEQEVEVSSGAESNCHPENYYG